MTESEILQAMLSSVGLVMTIFSMMFAIVSGYLAALYLFLARTPLTLRLLAFGLLSIAFVFLGGSAATVGTLQDALFVAWGKLSGPIVDVERLRNPVPLPVQFGSTVSMQEIGVAIGWAVAILVYLSLAFLTFVYRWPAGIGQPATPVEQHSLANPTR